MIAKGLNSLFGLVNYWRYARELPKSLFFRSNHRQNFYDNTHTIEPIGK